MGAYVVAARLLLPFLPVAGVDFFLVDTCDLVDFLLLPEKIFVNLKAWKVRFCSQYPE